MIKPSRPVPVAARWALVVAAVALWLGATAGWRPFATPDEGRYVGVAWEMLRSGDWSVPTLDGLPFFHKPPLFYWITAAAMSVGSVHPWVARAASLLAAVAAALALYAFARRWSGSGRAQAAVVLLVTQPLFYGAAQYANLDMLVAGCISLAVLAFADAVLKIQRAESARASILAGYAATAFGVLAKGLIGAVLPLIVIGLWTLVLTRGSAWRLWRALLWWPGLLLFLLVVLPWFVLMQSRFPGFFDYFFIVQHVRRFAAGGFNNVQPMWFYFVALPVLCLPWMFWAWGWRHVDFWRDPEQRAVRLLMGLWAAAIVAFFTWPQSKLIGYVLPACVPLAYLLGDAAFSLRAAGERWVERAWWTSLVAAVMLGPLLIGVAARYQAVGGDELARALAPRTRDEPVLFIDRYPYDVPMLAGLDGVWVVIDNWADPALAAGDDWRKELADAAQFAAPAAAARLIAARDLGARLCAAPSAWVIAPLATAPAWLAGLVPVRTQAQLALWHVDAARLRSLNPPATCPQKPNADPARR